MARGKVPNFLNVIDIEATCWDTNPPPEGEVSDIIEVGIAVLDLQTLEVAENTSILVKPTRSKVSPFCTQLTTLTQETIDAGVSLQDACSRLKKEFSAGDRVWASWGDYDRKIFERNCRELAIRYPFGPRHINIKTLYALLRRNPAEMGMERALEAEGLPLEGTHHRGGDDAKNIARIFAKLLDR